MGASLALAGLSACTKQPTEFIMPYVNTPEKLIPGKPLFYATAFPVNGIANPRSGRNARIPPHQGGRQSGHPASLGAADVPTQASILGLYDPDRAADRQLSGRNPVLRFVPDRVQRHSSISNCEKNGAGIRILTETVTSPTLYSQMQERLKLYPGAKWYQWEPTGHGRRMGTQLAFGQFLNPIYKFDQADVVLSIDGNFLGNGPGGVRYARDFVREAQADRWRDRDEPLLCGRNHSDFHRCQGRPSARREAFGDGSVPAFV